MNIVLMLAAIAAADPAPVQTSLTPTADAWVGQKQTLVVLVRVPTYFAGPTTFDLPSIPGVVLIPPAGSPVIGSETIDGVSYTTQRHEIAVYPLRAGRVKIPAFPVRFSQAGGGAQPPSNRREPTQQVEFTANLPPGAEKLATLVTTPELTMTETWTPEPGPSAKVGDAFSRQVTVRAKNVPGLAIPPLRLADVDGLAAYPKPAEVNDHSDRGTLTGERIETIVCVCEQAGTVTIPKRTLTWWNPDEKKLNRAALGERTIEIAALPAAQANANQQSESAKSGNWMLIIAIAAVGIGMWLARRRLRIVGRALREFPSSVAIRIRRAIRVGELAPLNPPADRK